MNLNQRNSVSIFSATRKLKKYNISVDLAVLERIAGSLGLFQRKFLKDMKESIADMKAGRVVVAKGIDRL